MYGFIKRPLLLLYITLVLIFSESINLSMYIDNFFKKINEILNSFGSRIMSFFIL